MVYRAEGSGWFSARMLWVALSTSMMYRCTQEGVRCSPRQSTAPWYLPETQVKSGSSGPLQQDQGERLWGVFRTHCAECFRRLD